MGLQEVGLKPELDWLRIRTGGRGL
jgi:hypothetical protein